MKNGLVLERNVESFLRYDYAAIQRAVSAKRVQTSSYITL